MRIKLTETFVTLLAGAAVATWIAAPAMTQSNHKPIHQHAAGLRRDDAAKGVFASAIGPHSPNPAWDVYSHSGKYIGSDPDPRIRTELRREWDSRDYP